MILLGGILGLGVAIAGFVWVVGIVREMQKGRELVARVMDELTARKEQAQQVETRYRNLFDSVPVAIIVSNLDGSLVDINMVGVRLFGYENREQFMALNMRDLYVNPAERDRRMAVIKGETTAPISVEFQMRRKDGSTFPALSRNQSVRDASGKIKHLEGFVTDITDIKRLEADRQALVYEQRISARLQSVGALAAGIAHEINTPMQFVSDSVYFLKSTVDNLDALWPQLRKLSAANSPNALAAVAKDIDGLLTELEVEQLAADANDSAERVLDGVRRVTKIIRAMREFAHPDSGEHSLVDINGAIETTLTVCKNVYKEVADVQLELGDLPQVSCQYGEINQVLLNVVVNAAHAIESRHTDGSKGLIRIGTQAEDGWVVIRIGDDGTGIPESVRARIFDPFFTTKEVGKGTGQGLAIVRSVIVDRHHGRIAVESEMGKGTTFVLHLPVQSQQSVSSGVSHEQEA